MQAKRGTDPPLEGSTSPPRSKLSFENPQPELKIRIKTMDKVIRTHFRLEKINRVRKGIVPGNSGLLWKAISIAKSIDTFEIPEMLHLL